MRTLDILSIDGDLMHPECPEDTAKFVGEVIVLGSEEALPPEFKMPAGGGIVFDSVVSVAS